MKLNDMSVEELELLSYTDLTYMILKKINWHEYISYF